MFAFNTCSYLLCLVFVVKVNSDFVISFTTNKNGTSIRVANVTGDPTDYETLSKIVQALTPPNLTPNNTTSVPIPNTNTPDSTPSQSNSTNQPNSSTANTVTVIPTPSITVPIAPTTATVANMPTIVPIFDLYPSFDCDFHKNFPPSHGDCDHGHGHHGHGPGPGSCPNHGHGRY